jgi:hypothetical protein
VKCFYDTYEKGQLWGKDLYTHLDEIYGKKSRFCVLFASSDYATKVWTNHERTSAQARAIKTKGEYILPVRFDDTDIPGLRKTIGYIDARSHSPEQVCELILEKMRSAGLIVAATAKSKGNGQDTDFPAEPKTQAGKELLDLIKKETELQSRGVVEIRKEIIPGITHFFPKLEYAGQPLAIRTRPYKEAIAELVSLRWLYPPEENESTNTRTYEYRTE